MQNMLLLLLVFDAALTTIAVGVWLSGRIDAKQPGIPWKFALALGATLGITGALSWFVWALWLNTSHNGTSDRWLAVMTGIGAASASIGVVVGGAWALMYGRKASVSIAAVPHAMEDGGFLIAARPVVRAVGLFRVRFHDNEGATIEVREVHDDPGHSSGLRLSDYKWNQAAVFGGAQSADGGEALPTTALFRVPRPADAVVGWMVWLVVRAPNRFMRLVPTATGGWADRIFIPRPPSQGIGSQVGNLEVD